MIKSTLITQSIKYTSLLQMARVVFMSWWITGWYTVITLLTLPFTFKKCRRQRANKLITAWSSALLRIIRVKYTIHNPHHFVFEPNKPYIVMCNHNSVYDIPLSFMAVNGSMRMVAKQEISRIPLFGYAMKLAEFIFIDRKNREQAIKDLETAKQEMMDGIIIWICPEGTRSRDGNLLPFKTGGFIMALQTGATIIPLGIRGTHELLQPHSYRIKLNHEVEMYFGQPVDASQFTTDQRDELIASVTREIKIAAGLK